MKEFDVVKLLVNKNNIKAGSIGTIVDIVDEGKLFYVEFLDSKGDVIDCVCLDKKNT